MSTRSSLAILALASVAFAACSGPDGELAREQRALRGEDTLLVPDESERAADLEASVDALLNPLVERNLVSGSILIAKGGEVLLAKGYGFADREHRAANTAHTPFRLASLSKSVTAVAVLQLVDKGLLDLGCTLEAFIPGFAHGERITVEHLLAHRSGIPSDVYLDGFREKSAQSITLEDAIDWVRKEARPRFEPGARFDYSNSGYLLLTSIVEKASGLPFEQYLAGNVFNPAGMTCSGLDSAALILAGRARGYSRTELGEVTNAAYRDPSFGWGYGALYSTVLDLLNFDRALMDGRLLSSASRRMMWTARSDTPWGNQYGLGWFVDDLDGNGVVIALGSTGGYVATLRHFPADDTVVVVLLNHDFMLYEELFDQLSLLALGKQWKPILEHPASPAHGQLSALVGTYEMDDGAFLKLRAVDGRLEFGDPRSEVFFEVFALSEREGYVPEQNAKLRFGESGEGEVELFALYGNLAWHGRRIPEAQREK